MKKIVDSFEFVPVFAKLPDDTKAKIVIEKRTGKDIDGHKDGTMCCDPGGVVYKLYIKIKHLRHRRKIIGDIGIWKVKSGFYETHCDGLYDPKFFNCGWGIELYYQIIHWSLKSGIIVKSSHIETMSNSAKRCWESKRLNSKVEIAKRRDLRFHVKGLIHA
jgi:hypothetical protein